ncbi:DUF6461 domain-containing protein [Actinoplanes ianthinogenes]|uniref:DUF6461 domain-containing protein n=1 Tax=Actinoplanes ianthinogenes TaxID=122358 RepID=UPI00167034B8|nr:DUF6461 domain-containing protein [Actinoplanes ianthinogenes]
MTAADFDWFEQEEPGLAVCFTFSWLAGLTPEQVVRRIGGRPVGRFTWTDAPEDPDDGVIVLVTRAGDWALMIETYTMYGTYEATTELCRDTRLIANFRNVELDGMFLLAENGERLVDFDPYTAYSRSGERPDMLVPEMKALGFQVEQPTAPEPSPTAEFSETEAGFALAERLTRVPFTSELLNSSTYLAAVVPDPLDGAVYTPDQVRTAPT